MGDTQQLIDESCAVWGLSRHSPVITCPDTGDSREIASNG